MSILSIKTPWIRFLTCSRKIFYISGLLSSPSILSTRKVVPDLNVLYEQGQKPSDYILYGSMT